MNSARIMNGASSLGDQQGRPSAPMKAYIMSPSDGVPGDSCLGSRQSRDRFFNGSAPESRSKGCLGLEKNLDSITDVANMLSVIAYHDNCSVLIIVQFRIVTAMDIDI